MSHNEFVTDLITIKLHLTCHRSENMCYLHSDEINFVQQTIEVSFPLDVPLLQRCPTPEVMSQSLSDVPVGLWVQTTSVIVLRFHHSPSTRALNRRTCPNSSLSSQTGELSSQTAELNSSNSRVELSNSRAELSWPRPGFHRQISQQLSQTMRRAGSLSGWQMSLLGARGAGARPGMRFVSTLVWESFLCTLCCSDEWENSFFRPNSVDYSHIIGIIS